MLTVKEKCGRIFIFYCRACIGWVEESGDLKLRGNTLIIGIRDFLVSAHNKFSINVGLILCPKFAG